jgi:hypothetical protein
MLGIAGMIAFRVEVPVQLVLALVFKTSGSHGDHVIGGFDSHALPPFYFAYSRNAVALRETLCYPRP